MSLDQWEKNGWLRRHVPALGELRDLLAVADRDIKDCQARGLSDDWRFGIAYNAALQLARAALLAAGYEIPKGESHHFRAIDSLALTIEAETGFIDRLQVARKKRSAGVYEVSGMISAADAREMRELAEELRGRVRVFLQQRFPELAGR